MSTFAQITALVAAVVFAAAVAYRLCRRRTASDVRAASPTGAHFRRDDLTGVGDRRGFRAALADITAGPRTVVLINLDGSRPLVSRLGDRAFDQVLVLIAGRIRHAAAGASVFRLRRDEFAVILDDPAGADRRAARLVAAVAEPTEVHLSGRPVTVTVTGCAGVAVAPAGADPRVVLIHADRAMRAAKRAGRGSTATFNPAMMHGPGAAAEDGGQHR